MQLFEQMHELKTRTFPNQTTIKPQIQSTKNQTLEKESNLLIVPNNKQHPT